MALNINASQEDAIHDQLRRTVERDASESPDPLSSADSTSPPIQDEPVKTVQAADSSRRISQMPPPATTGVYQSPYLPKADPAEQKSIKKRSMSGLGVDLTSEAGQASDSISWHEPHPIFVIILVSHEEIPFGIQKDVLCAQSPYYRHEFAQSQANKVEHIVKLPDTDVPTFGCFQNFVYTGNVYDKRGGRSVPNYTTLLGVWKLATQLSMTPLRVAVLDAMAERRRQTGFIPGVSLLVDAWRQTEDGSGLRKMLIEWAAEHMRSHASERSKFAQSLPQDILSALVVELSGMPVLPVASGVEPRALAKRPFIHTPDELETEQPRVMNKRPRKSAIDLSSTGADELLDIKPTVKKPARKSEPVRKVNRRVSAPAAASDEDPNWTPEKEMAYCRDLIKRMVSGPGYWTRYVPNFKRPVDPIADNAPNYFDVVKRPMCLSVMKEKMDKDQYASGADFEADIRLIFQNCYEYWTPSDIIWKECETFEKFFDNQWAQRKKYLGHGPKRIKAEATE